MKGKVETNEPTLWEKALAESAELKVKNKWKYYKDNLLSWSVIAIFICLTIWLFQLTIRLIGNLKVVIPVSPQLTQIADKINSFFNLSIFWTDTLYILFTILLIGIGIYSASSSTKIHKVEKMQKYVSFFSSLIFFYYFSKLYDIHFISVELYLLFFICFILSTLSTLLVNKSVTIFKFCLTKSDLSSINTFFPSVLIVLQLQYFQDNTVVKALLLLLFIFLLISTFYYSYKRYIYINFFKKSTENDQKIMNSEGMITEQDSSFDSLIIMNFVGSVGAWITGLIMLMNNLMKKNEFNHGLFDLSNKKVYIINSNDKLYNYITFSVIATIIISLGFNFIGLCHVFIFINILKFSKSTVRTKLNEFNTSVTGDLITGKKNIYVDFISRVFPRSFHTALLEALNKKASYGILFHHADNYIVNGKILKWNEIHKDVYHSILIDNTTKIPYHSKFILESDFCLNLKRVDVIIEGFGHIKITEEKSDISITNLENDWIEKRMGLIKKLVDEKFISVVNFENKLSSDLLNFEKLRNHINQFASTEALRLNIILFQNHYNEFYLNIIKDLNGKGIFEINTLVRQVHESASIPSRFIDNLNIAEVIIRYLVGFLHATQQNTDYQLNKYDYETKAISFGGALSYLSQFRKKHLPNSILEKRIQSYLAFQYTDVENIESLRKYMIDLGWTERLTTKPDIELLFWWISNIRNKTRGHGTPSKVDFEFYVCIQKIILFVVHEFSRLGIEMYVRSNIEDQKWIINYSKGGLPVLFPDEIEIDRKVHFNIYMPDDEIDSIINTATITKNNVPENSQVPYIKLEENGKVEWWKCENHFFEKDGIIYLLNQRNEKKENWISFTTGDIIRPKSMNINVIP